MLRHCRARPGREQQGHLVGAAGYIAVARAYSAIRWKSSRSRETAAIWVRLHLADSAADPSLRIAAKAQHIGDVSALRAGLYQLGHHKVFDLPGSFGGGHRRLCVAKAVALAVSVPHDELTCARLDGRLKLDNHEGMPAGKERRLARMNRRPFLSVRSRGIVPVCRADAAPIDRGRVEVVDGDTIRRAVSCAWSGAMWSMTIGGAVSLVAMWLLGW